jgi:hypothetical protein
VPISREGTIHPGRLPGFHDETKAEYYQFSCSQRVHDGITANPDDPFSDVYQTSMYADAQTHWDESSTDLDLAGRYDTKGDDLQFVVLVMTVFFKRSIGA